MVTTLNVSLGWKNLARNNHSSLFVQNIGDEEGKLYNNENQRASSILLPLTTPNRHLTKQMLRTHIFFVG
jgi:hypothetical protein